MSTGSIVLVPPIRFGGFTTIRSRMATGTPAMTLFVGIDQRQGMAVVQTVMALGSNQHAGVGVSAGTVETGLRSVASSGIIVGQQTSTAPQGETITQFWSE
ncbi:MAG: hypothetical protein HQL95_13150 [Magnetococcales bacterium]|nr:hypothetical protein [Magnetococcales bacterium]